MAVDSREPKKLEVPNARSGTPGPDAASHLRFRACHGDGLPRWYNTVC
jgi:hypothetical protein